MTELELQSEIFEKKLSRRQLMDYASSYSAQYKICVYRNHSFELIEHTLPIYLDYAGIGAEFVYSDYDDSLSFLELPNADMLILWLDLERYKTDDTAGFINSRIGYLISVFKKPVLLVTVGGELTPDSRVLYFDAGAFIAEKFGEKAFDLRMEPFTGTRLSQNAISEIARKLGLLYIPALLKPSLKAVVVDMDNTLYSGVLGEDGIDGIKLTDGHIALQNHLKKMSEQGFFLCAASKNEEADVLEMLEKRTDFPLRKKDFTKLCISWQSKADSIKQIAEFLNVGFDSLLFIDDNIGEISSVKSRYPSVHCIRAYDDAALTESVLENYPGTFKFASTAEDSLRNSDVNANAKRSELQNSMSHEDYLRSLEATLRFSIDDKERAQRVYELANKTNQFIFNYKRYTRTQVDDLIASPDSCIVTVSLSDRLSDSGLIGVCVGTKVGDHLEIEECFVSCRALGRGLDEAIVLGAIAEVCHRLEMDKVHVMFRNGERNAPAKAFAEKNLSGYLDTAEKFEYTFPDELIRVITED